jgi:hypothetical protein
MIHSEAAMSGMSTMLALFGRDAADHRAANPDEGLGVGRTDADREPAVADAVEDDPVEDDPVEGDPVEGDPAGGDPAASGPGIGSRGFELAAATVRAGGGPNRGAPRPAAAPSDGSCNEGELASTAAFAARARRTISSIEPRRVTSSSIGPRPRFGVRSGTAARGAADARGPAFEADVPAGMRALVGAGDDVAAADRRSPPAAPGAARSVRFGKG